jgi:hypothetical protein
MNELYFVYIEHQQKCVAIVDNKDLADFIVASYPVPCVVQKTKTEITLKDLDTYTLFR